MTTLLGSKDRCPHIKSMSVYDPKTYKTYESPDYCNLNDKPCILGTYSECIVWKEIQDDCGHC